MDSKLKPVTTMPTNSSVGVGEMVEKPIPVASDAEKQSEDLGSRPFDMLYSAKENAQVRWKLDLILLPLV